MKLFTTLSLLTFLFFSDLQPVQAQQSGFIGEVRMFAGNFAPRGWAFCEGQLLPISQNAALFSIIGTMYGGNGRTTFALPDLRGRVPVGVGNGPGLSPVSQGQRFGSESVVLNISNLPSHSHIVNAVLQAVSEAGDSGDPTGRYLANSGFFDKEYRSAGTLVNMANALNGQTNATGSNSPVNIQQPSLGIRYIIATQGTFPSR